MFTREEIEEDLEEVQYLGNKWTHRAQVDRWWDAKWFYELGFLTLRVPVNPILPVGTQNYPCKTCGGILQTREGCKQVFHLGGDMRCRNREVG